MGTANILSFVVLLIGTGLGALLAGFMGYCGVKLASRIFGPIDIRTLDSQD